MDAMTAIRYRIVLEGAAPEAEPDRIAHIVERIWPGRNLGPDDFPLELPRRFDLRGATEWMEALTRAGLRARAEVEGLSGKPSAEELGEAGAAISSPRLDDAPDLDEPPLPTGPWALFQALVVDPADVFRRMPREDPARAIVFGWLMLAIGTTLALPADLWLLRRMSAQIGAAPSDALVPTMLLFEPLVKLFIWMLVIRLLAGFGGLGGSWREAAALAGLAQVWQPLRAIPLLGPVATFFGTLWMVGTGLGEHYALAPRRLVGLLLFPIAFGGLAFAMLMIALGMLLAQFPELGVASGRFPF